MQQSGSCWPWLHATLTLPPLDPCPLFGARAAGGALAWGCCCRGRRAPTPTSVARPFRRRRSPGPAAARPAPARRPRRATAAATPLPPGHQPGQRHLPGHCACSPPWPSVYNAACHVQHVAGPRCSVWLAILEAECWCWLQVDGQYERKFVGLGALATVSTPHAALQLSKAAPERNMTVRAVHARRCFCLSTLRTLSCMQRPSSVHRFTRVLAAVAPRASACMGCASRTGDDSSP